MDFVRNMRFVGVVLAGVAMLAVLVAARPEMLLNPLLYVPTPIGYMLQSCVHRVPSGSVVTHEKDARTGAVTGRTIVRSESGSMIRIIPKCDTSELPMLYTGAGGADRRSPAGPASRSLLQFPPDYDGWEAYTMFNYPAGFDAMLNVFNTPAAPADTPDVLYLFPGLQNVDWIPKVDPLPSGPFDIIQPVIQYPGDNGNYWSVKSWYVTLNAGYLVSDEIQLNVGDLVYGNQTRLDATTWFIGSTQMSTGQSTTITAQADWLSSQPYAYNTLECYGCYSCGYYPVKSPALFTDIILMAGGKQITPTWKITPKPPEQYFCKEAATVQNAETVTINFGNE